MGSLNSETLDTTVCRLDLIKNSVLALLLIAISKLAQLDLWERISWDWEVIECWKERQNVEPSTIYHKLKRFDTTFIFCDIYGTDFLIVRVG